MRRSGGWVGLIVSTLLLAGCLDADSGNNGIPTPVGPSPVHGVFNGTDCVVQAAVIPVGFDHAYQWLPPGYVPADAADLLGIPVPTGSAALGLANAQCDDSGLGGFSFQAPLVFIKPPKVDIAYPPNMVSGYSPGWYAGNAPLLEQMQETHIPTQLVQGGVDVGIDGSESLDALRSVSVLSSTWSDGTDLLWNSQGLGTAPFTFSGDGFIAWTDHNEGTSFYVARLGLPTGVEEITFSVGEVDCTARAGSLPARMLGSTQCPADSLALNVLDFEFLDSGFHFYPGVHA